MTQGDGRPDQPGRAGGSMEQVVAAEHRHLDALFAEVRRAFASADPEADAFDALKRLAEALDVHFVQEDELYYPAITALRPETKPDVESISDGHRVFRAQLGGIVRDLYEGRVEHARGEFEAFTREFAKHEIAEERLLRSLDLEPRA